MKGRTPRAVALWAIATACMLAFAIWPRTEPREYHTNSCASLWQNKIRKHSELIARRREAVVGEPNVFINKNAYDPFEATFTCDTEDRRGRSFGDGGKFVCGDQTYFQDRRDTRCLVYSVGSNGDPTFEQDVVSNFGCEVHTFDPTGNSTLFRQRLEMVGAQFHTIGVGGASTLMRNTVTGETARVLPIKDIMDYLGHSEAHVDILKIDCEGCEYAAFETLWPQIINGSVSIGQIQIEMHGTDLTRLTAFFESAERAGFMIFHKERNHWGCQGYLCVEYSMIQHKEAEQIFRHTYCRS